MHLRIFHPVLRFPPERRLRKKQIKNLKIFVKPAAFFSTEKTNQTASEICCVTPAAHLEKQRTVVEEMNKEIVAVKCWTRPRAPPLTVRDDGLPRSCAAEQEVAEKTNWGTRLSQTVIKSRLQTLFPILNGNSVYITNKNTQTQNLTRTFGFDGAKNRDKDSLFLFFFSLCGLDPIRMKGVNI